jgi:uncharacterized damage-inducible protein DinB
MNPTSLIAKQLEDFHFGGNWTAVNMRETLGDLNWQEATQKIGSLHSISELVYHINYFIRVVNRVMQGHPLEGNDAVSFDCPPVNSQADWEALKEKSWEDARTFSALAAKLPEARLEELLGDKKYGTYQRNLNGIIEHSHYHLGQIVLIKKLIRSSSEK